MFEPPLPLQQAGRIELVKGPNISALPDFGPVPDRIEAPVALKVGDDVSTDAILPAGARALPYLLNIPKLRAFTSTHPDEPHPRPGSTTPPRHRPLRVLSAALRP